MQGKYPGLRKNSHRVIHIHVAMYKAYFCAVLTWTPVIMTADGVRLQRRWSMWHAKVAQRSWPRTPVIMTADGVRLQRRWSMRHAKVTQRSWPRTPVIMTADGVRLQRRWSMWHAKIAQRSWPRTPVMGTSVVVRPQGKLTIRHSWLDQRPYTHRVPIISIFNDDSSVGYTCMEVLTPCRFVT